MHRLSSMANSLLRSPLLWGGLVSLAFFAALRNNWIDSPFLDRYCDAHPINVASQVMFFIGLAAVVIRSLKVLGQFGVLGAETLGPAPAGGQPVSDAPALIGQLDTLPPMVQGTHMVARLRSALVYVRDTDSADTLEDQLERLSNLDRDRVSAAYALPRLVRAVLPIVGMLGTVVGITVAIGELNPDNLEELLSKVTASLSIAFDTTAQAMVGMIVLWFTIFGVEVMEERLLQRVDDETSRLLLSRFQTLGGASDPGVASMRRMGEQVVLAVERLAAQQADTWQSAIDQTHARWASATASAGDLLVDSLRGALRENLQDHSAGLVEGAQRQVARLADSIDKQTSLVGSLVERQLGKLAEFESMQANRMEAATREHSTRLVTSAEGLVGHLRDGLERMAELLVEALQKHGETLTQAEESLASENRRHLSEVEAALGEAMVVAADRQEKLIRQSEALLQEMQESLVTAAGATVAHQGQLVRQGEVLLKVVESTAQISRLEDTLNRNLASLGRAHNFEETLLSLSAAIQLLSARVGRDREGAQRVALPTSHAA
ncbi:MAG: MotA/TolQ/ExbB proton channel family protein [Lacipirellulaceae bacterium]